MPQRRIANKISLASLTLTMTIVVVLGGVSYFFSRHTLKEQIEEKLSFEAALISHRLEIRLTNLNEDMRGMAANLIVVNALIDTTGRDMYIGPFLQSYRAHHDLHCLLTLCDFEGKPLTSCDGHQQLHTYSDPAMLDQVVAKGEPLAKIKKNGESPSLLIAHPVIYGATGRPEGMLVIEVPLAPILSRCVPEPSGGLKKVFTLSSPHGAIWSNADGRSLPMLRVSAPLALKAPLDRLELTMGVAEIASQAYAPLQTLTFIYLAIAIGVVILTVAVSRLIGSQLTTPLLTLTNMANRVAEQGLLEEQIALRSNDEISQLAASFNTMLARLRESHATLERKVEERTSQLSEAVHTLNTILETAPIGVTKVVDRQQVWLNRRIEEMFQYPKQEMEFQSARKLYPSDEAYDALGRQAYPLLAQGVVFDTEQEMVRRDGSRIQVRCIGKALAPQDMSQGVLWLLEDITERKLAENRLKELARELQTILDTLTVGISFVKDRKIQWANTAHDRIFGYGPGGSKGLAPSTCSADGNDYSGLGEGSAHPSNGTTYTTEMEMHARDGRRFWCALTGRAVDSEDLQQGSIWMLQDISARKAAEDQLRDYAETQKVLLREVNHRVKNNLVAIISMLHQEEDLALQAGMPEYVARLREVVWRVEGLLTVHRLLSSSAWQPLELHSLCKGVIQGTLKGLPSGRTLRLEVSPSDVRVDSDQAHHLALVFNELATNTMKYALKERETGAITITVARRDGKVEIVYHDDGPGFPEAVLQGAFPASGIGFPLLFGLVKRSLQGTITLANDDGAVARISFPAIKHDLAFTEEGEVHATLP